MATTTGMPPVTRRGCAASAGGLPGRLGPGKQVTLFHHFVRGWYQSPPGERQLVIALGYYLDNKDVYAAHDTDWFLRLTADLQPARFYHYASSQGPVEVLHTREVNLQIGRSF